MDAYEGKAAERLEHAQRLLAQRGEQEATALAAPLADQRKRLAGTLAKAEKDDDQMTLGFLAEEKRERTLDRQHWAKKLADLDRQVESEPERLRASYAVRADRLEPVGLVYLWPEGG